MAEVISKATREGYAAGLLELGKTNEKVVVLDADLAGATKTGAFAKEYKDRFFNCGISEQNLMGVAAGLSLSGYIPFASSFAMFAVGRAFEQIRNSIGYPGLNVKIGATHAGISVGEDGASHQCNEDIALMRTIPGMTIINPADFVEAKAAVIAASEHEGPVYMRFGRLAVPVIFDDDYKFEWGKANVLRQGDDLTIVATGLMVNEALIAYENLKNKGINARIINVHTIKPLDEETILTAAKETGKILVCEEHNIIGGLGGAVSELLSSKLPTKVVRLGVNDEFGHSGPAKDLLKEFGLSAENIEKMASDMVKD